MRITLYFLEPQLNLCFVLPVGKVGINSLLQKVLVLCYQHQVKLESRFVSVVVAIGVLEGMGRQLDPDVDILKKVTPYALRAAVVSAAEAANLVKDAK